MDNNEAIAYATIAMRNKGFSERDIERVTNEMFRMFDMFTEREAKEIASSGKIVG